MNEDATKPPPDETRFLATQDLGEHPEGPAGPGPSLLTQYLDESAGGAADDPDLAVPKARRTNVDTLISKRSTRIPALAAGDDVPQVQREALAALEADFELLQGFAEGGQASIATAKDRKLNRLVAVKSLKPDFVGKPRQVDGFLTEAGITAQLDHPSVVPIYALCTDADAGLHIAIKLINGKTLREYLNEVVGHYASDGIRRFDENQALLVRLEYFTKVCEAIAYAHSRGILHRDLKPENIMIGEFGEVYVMDWGIALKLEEVTGAVSGRLRQGTPGYMAPELLSNEGISAHSDVFSLGVILHEVAALQPPYSGTTADELIRQTVSGETVPLAHRCSEARLSPDLAAIIAKAMHRDPQQRYAGVEALRKDVRQFIGGHEVSARPDNAIRAARRWLFQHQVRSLSIFFGTLLVLAALTIHSLINKYQAEQLARDREYVLANVQNDVSVQAHLVDTHILSLESALRQFGDQASFLLEHPPMASAVGPRRIPRYIALQDLATAPAGTVSSPLYNENVSFDFCSYKLAPGVEPPGLEPLLQQLLPLDRGLLRAMVESDPALVFDPDHRAAQVARAATAGYPLRFIYLGLQNGLILTFPAKSDYDEAYDPRARPWYQLGAQSAGVAWTKPYYDAWGQGLVLSPSYPVRDADGELLGVAGADITLEYIVHQLLGEHTRPAGLRGHRFVVDEAGYIMLDSSLENMADSEKAAALAELQLKRYPYREIDPLLRHGRGGQQEIDTASGPMVLACAPIPAVRWFYIEELPLAGVDFRQAAAVWGTARERPASGPE